MPPAPAADGSRAILWMLASCVFFALMALFVGFAHAADPGLHTAVASLFRAATNLVALVILARGRWAPLVGDGRPALWARGVLGAASLLTYFGSLAWLDIGESAFLNYTSAIWVAVLAPFVLGERTRPEVAVAVLGSLVGIGLLVEPRGGDGVGRALGLGSGLIAAFAYLSVRRASATNGPLAIVFYFTAIATVATGAWWAIGGWPLPQDPRVVAALAGSGLAATAGQLLMTRAYQLGRAAPVAAAGAAGPLVTTLLGALALGQLPDAGAAVGMGVLLVTSVALPLASERLEARRAAAQAAAPEACPPPA
jgi:S-adenosylmethionine uptake transporter